MKFPTFAVATGALLAASAAVAGRITIVSENEAPKTWAPAPGTPRVVAGYPKAVADPSQDVCITIGYLIDAEGKTSNFVEMKSWTSGAGERKPEQSAIEPYVQLAAATVSLWKFAPVGKARQIYTSSSFAFAGSKALGEEEIRTRCRIDDLPAFVAAAQRNSRDRSRIATEQQAAQARKPTGQSGY